LLVIADLTWAVCCALDFDLSVTGDKSLVSWGDCFLQDDFPLGGSSPARTLFGSEGALRG
jgi:hypothetical protein